MFLLLMVKFQGALLRALCLDLGRSDSVPQHLQNVARKVDNLSQVFKLPINLWLFLAIDL